MAKNIHKGTELNNIKETWEQNERAEGEKKDYSDKGAIDDDDITKVVREEAREYDNMNNEEKLLGGERATINDDDKESEKER